MTTSNGDGGTPAIELRNLHRHFGRLRAVDGVSLKVYPGQVMGFIGPNGAGKTTAMRILATLDIPTEGEVFIHGYSVIDDPDKVRRIVGFMPDSIGKYANMDVVEYVDFFARAYGLSGDARRDAVERVLVFTELRKLADKSIKTLSKGMSQRLALGRTLIHDPAVLILDEPAAGLDPRARIELRGLIHVLAVEQHKTVLISSHILTELGEICDSAAIIEAGRLLASGTMTEIMQAQHSSEGRADKPAISVRVLRDADKLGHLLRQEPYVRNVELEDRVATFEFNGDETELAAILRRLIKADLEVVDFRGRVDSLEDAFMAITRGITQ
ncbi:ABC transporter ATP-binding protein [Singulisphaera sp. PoT]|uniref:ABC transporter ATP-binding protein n=1 Tax=Singulisphaera sp. PoT TaxID=3411797 RepID=UPI003BF584BE